MTNLVFLKDLLEEAPSALRFPQEQIWPSRIWCLDWSNNCSSSGLANWRGATVFIEGFTDRSFTFRRRQCGRGRLRHLSQLVLTSTWSVVHRLTNTDGFHRPHSWHHSLLRVDVVWKESWCRLAIPDSVLTIDPTSLMTYQGFWATDTSWGDLANSFVTYLVKLDIHPRSELKTESPSWPASFLQRRWLDPLSALTKTLRFC